MRARGLQNCFGLTSEKNLRESRGSVSIRRIQQMIRLVGSSKMIQLPTKFANYFNNTIWIKNSSTFTQILVRNLNDYVESSAPSMMENMATKREHEEVTQENSETKRTKTASVKQINTRIANLTHGNGRPLPRGVAEKLTDQDADLMEQVKTSCRDLGLIQKAIQLRIKHRLAVRLPDDYDDSTYFIDNGLRRVYPYHYIYQTYAKHRWLGCKLKDILQGEFRDISEAELKQRFDNNRVLVNGEFGNFEHTLKDNDFICNLNHRHELPVLAAPIKIIHMDRDTVIIDKPPSLPIHPCGRYRHNSVLNIMRKEHNLPDLKVVHRLDRLVSGVLILARNSHKAHEFEVALKGREVQKEYVCRVVGEFPLGDEANNGEILVDQPLEVISNKIGITVCMAGGKESATSFKRLNYNGKTSAVLCKPKTGRMHQIRVHLQYLGHPIVNDNLYNCDSFGPNRGKGGDFGGKSLKQLSDEVVDKHRSDVWLLPDTTDYHVGVFDEEDTKVCQKGNIPLKTDEFLSDQEREETLAALDHLFSDKSWLDYQERWKFDPKKMIPSSDCRDCKTRYYDPPKRCLFLYLHAFKYSGKGWSYETDLPGWAQESWKY